MNEKIQGLQSESLKIFADEMNECSQKLRTEQNFEYASWSKYVELCSKTYSFYLEFWVLLAKKDYYESWCKLEQAELCAKNVIRNIEICGHDFDIRSLLKVIRSFQMLYPYRLFYSPGMIVHKCRCSVCGADFNVFKSCPHQRGLIYDGILCSGINEEFDMSEISIVTKPVQKYSVLFTEGIDEGFNFDFLTEVFERLNNPYEKWECKKVNKIVDRNKVSIPDSALCPCGSDKAFGECCSNKELVSIEHIEVNFMRPVRGYDGPAFQWTRK